VPVLSENSENAVIRTFPIYRDFCGATAKKALNIKLFGKYKAARNHLQKSLKSH
jgi:hypothetical protein